MNKKEKSKYIFTIFHFTLLWKLVTHFCLNFFEANCGRSVRSFAEPSVTGKSQSPKLHFHVLFLFLTILFGFLRGFWKKKITLGRHNFRGGNCARRGWLTNPIAPFVQLFLKQARRHCEWGKTLFPQKITIKTQNLWAKHDCWLKLMAFTGNNHWKWWIGKKWNMRMLTPRQWMIQISWKLWGLVGSSNSFLHQGCGPNPSYFGTWLLFGTLIGK